MSLILRVNTPVSCVYVVSIDHIATVRSIEQGGQSATVGGKYTGFALAPFEPALESTEFTSHPGIRTQTGRTAPLPTSTWLRAVDCPPHIIG